jgi:hypothetical protein
MVVQTHQRQEVKSRNDLVRRELERCLHAELIAADGREDWHGSITVQVQVVRGRFETIRITPERTIKPGA